MNRKDWRECYWFDKGLNRQRITRKSTDRAYISEALETIQDQAVEAKIDAWVQDQIDRTVQAEIDQAWADYTSRDYWRLVEAEEARCAWLEMERDRRFEALNYWRDYLTK